MTELSSSSPGTIQEIHLEGAKIKELCILAGGRVVVRLEGVRIHKRATADQDLPVCNASLWLSGVGLMNIHGSLTEGGDPIFSEDFIDAEGAKVGPAYLRGQELRYVRLRLASNACVGIACTRAVLRLSRRSGSIEEEAAP